MKALAIDDDPTSELPPCSTSTTKKATNFCFISESCLPIQTLAKTIEEIDSSSGSSDVCNPYTTLTGKCNSWVNYRHEADNGFAQQLQVMDNALGQ